MCGGELGSVSRGGGFLLCKGRGGKYRSGLLLHEGSGGGKR